MIKITLSSILEDLSNGYTRKVTSKNYDSEIGSIQEKYSLTATEIDSLFKHPKLKGKKTTFAPKLSFELVDDLDGVTLTSEESKEELAAIVLEVNHTNEVEVDSLSIDRMIKQNEKKVSKVPDILEEETEEVEANS
jgi:hypothetical protein